MNSTIRPLLLAALAFWPVAGRAGWQEAGPMPAPRLAPNGLVFTERAGRRVGHRALGGGDPGPLRSRPRARARPFVRRREPRPRRGARGGEDGQRLLRVITTPALRVVVRHSPLAHRLPGHAPARRSTRTTRPSGWPRRPGGPRLEAAARRRARVRLRREDRPPRQARLERSAATQYTMWNSDTYAYDSSTDPIYVSVPVLHRAAPGEGARHLPRQHVPQRRSTSAARRTRAARLRRRRRRARLLLHPRPAPEAGDRALHRAHRADAAAPALGARLPPVPLQLLPGVAGSASSPRTSARADVPADVIWLDIHYQDGYKPFTWDRERFPDPDG